MRPRVVSVAARSPIRSLSGTTPSTGRSPGRFQPFTYAYFPPLLPITRPGRGGARRLQKHPVQRATSSFLFISDGRPGKATAVNSFSKGK